MKIAFSNIAWTPHDDPDVLQLLAHHGVGGIEIAPTAVWPGWKDATPANASRYGRWLRGLGFEVPALQAVLFDRPDALLFDREGEAALMTHLTLVAELAGALGARAVVFGAPRQRNRGALSMTAAMDRAAEVMHTLARIFAAHDTCLCIEPNPRRYACNFIVNAAEGAELVRRVNHPGFQLHLDAAGMFLEGDSLEAQWPRVGELLRHFHISEPDLGDFREPKVEHRHNLEVLSSKRYQGWCSVEMRKPALPLAMAGPWNLLREPCAR